MPSPRSARPGSRLPAAPGWSAVVLLVLAVVSVGVGGSGLERAGSLVQVASGPAATPGGNSISQAGDGAAQLDAAVLGRPPADAGAGGSGGEGQGGKRDGAGGGPAGSSGSGSGESSGTPAQPGSATDTGALGEPAGSGTGAPGGGAPSGSGVGDTVNDTLGGVTDQVPDPPKPLPDTGDVVNGILDDTKLPGGLDKPNRLVP